MQLKVPKKYQYRRRRSIFSLPRLLLRLILLVGLIGIGYWLARNPDSAKKTIDDSTSGIRSRFSDTYDDVFPDQPTATPDVRTDVISCENAYLRGDMEDVIETCRAALPGRPNDVNLHFRLAHTLIITSDSGQNSARIQEAIIVAEETINANPEAADGYIIKAMALDWAQDYNRALGAAEQALEISPSSIYAKAVITNIYRNLGQLERATNSINEALTGIQQLPNPEPELLAQVYRNYGRLLASQGDSEDAIAPYKTAINAMPIETYIAVELAKDVYLALDQRSLAIGTLEDVRNKNPGDASVLYWLGVIHGQLGEPTEALQLYTLCVDANPNYVSCLGALGRGQYLINDNYAQAIDNLSRATELGSEDPYDWFLLGRSYYQIQRCQDAAAPLRKGYELIQQNESSQVDQSDFVRAFRDCNLAEPSS